MFDWYKVFKYFALNCPFSHFFLLTLFPDYLKESHVPYTSCLYSVQSKPKYLCNELITIFRAQIMHQHRFVIAELTIKMNFVKKILSFLSKIWIYVVYGLLYNKWNMLVILVVFYFIKHHSYLKCKVLFWKTEFDKLHLTHYTSVTEIFEVRLNGKS